MFADRTPKIPLEQIAMATRDPRTARDWSWCDRVMERLCEHRIVRHRIRPPSVFERASAHRG